MPHRVLLACLAMLISLHAAAQPSRAPIVFAAASLSDALTATADAYAATGRAKPVLSFAASSALARQIEHGAPAALFISADEQWMDYLAERNLIDTASRKSFLGNHLVLIAPTASALAFQIAPQTSLAEALGSGKLAVADPTSVPAGRYAQAALETLGLWTQVEQKTVRADNVRAALAFVERGEAAAGIVYATDAAMTEKVRVVSAFPDNSHPAITYPMALVGPAPSPEARAFYAYLTTEPAHAIFHTYGFIVK